MQISRILKTSLRQLTLRNVHQSHFSTIQKASLSHSIPLKTRSSSENTRNPWQMLLLLTATGAAISSTCIAQNEVNPTTSTLATGSTAAGAANGNSLVANQEQGETEQPKPGRSIRRGQLLKARHQHQAKLEEKDLVQIRLEEYKKVQSELNEGLAARFDLYASQLFPDKKTKAMTFTDFLHALVLPRFHLKDPREDLVYTCDFVGDANGLISYEECYLLLHLLQIPPEHFDVAFCMFDLDGNGIVDKEEFCQVIENLLKSINIKKEQGSTININHPTTNFSAEETLPRLIKYLFGRFGKKKIRAEELENTLDLLRKAILKAEFDLYTSRPKQQVISVHDFALTLISCFDPERLMPLLERVETLHVSSELVTWEDFYQFHFHVQNNLEDIKLAFDLIGIEEITEADFIKATHVVSGVKLSFPVVKLAFRIFDTDGNGTLNKIELLKVLEMRSKIQLSKKRQQTKTKQVWSCIKGQEEQNEYK